MTSTSGRSNAVFQQPAAGPPTCSPHIDSSLISLHLHQPAPSPSSVSKINSDATKLQFRENRSSCCVRDLLSSLPGTDSFRVWSSCSCVDSDPVVHHALPITISLPDKSEVAPSETIRDSPECTYGKVQNDVRWRLYASSGCPAPSCSSTALDVTIPGEEGSEKRSHTLRSRTADSMKRVDDHR